jgi:CBS domain-containing protein
MMTIKDVIKEREGYFVRDTITTLEAAQYMAERKIGGVCVLNDEGKLVGILTERDLLNRVVIPHLDASNLPLRETMSEILSVIDVSEDPHQALERMEHIGRRHLPVVDGECWVGMLSMRDLMRVELSEQGDELKLLHEYISH